MQKPREAVEGPGEGPLDGKHSTTDGAAAIREGGAEDAGGGREMPAEQAAVFIHLAAQENGSQQYG